MGVLTHLPVLQHGNACGSKKHCRQPVEPSEALVTQVEWASEELVTQIAAPDLALATAIVQEEAPFEEVVT